MGCFLGLKGVVILGMERIVGLIRSLECVYLGMIVSIRLESTPSVHHLAFKHPILVWLLLVKILLGLRLPVLVAIVVWNIRNCPPVSSLDFF